MAVIRPKTLKIAHMKVDVVYTKNAEWTHDPDWTGASLPMQGLIDVRLGSGDQENSEDTIREILFHEIIHFVYHCTGLNQFKAKEADEERTISIISPTLLAVLRDNPKLCEYLTR